MWKSWSRVLVVLGVLVALDSARSCPRRILVPAQSFVSAGLRGSHHPLPSASVPRV